MQLDEFDDEVDVNIIHRTVVAIPDPSDVLQMTAWLRDHHYRVLELDVADHASVTEVLTGFASLVDEWPPNYADTFNGLSSAWSDIEVRDGSPGTAVILWNFDALVERQRDPALAFLDVLSRGVRAHLVAGRRMVVIVQGESAMGAPINCQRVHRWPPNPQDVTGFLDWRRS